MIYYGIYIQIKILVMNIFQAIRSDRCSEILNIKNIHTLLHEIQDERGFYPIHVACETEDTNALMLLVLLGANLNVVDPLFQYTPLHIACSYQNENAIRILTQHGADIFRKDRFYQTPLELYQDLFDDSYNNLFETINTKNPLFSNTRYQNKTIIRYLSPKNE